MAEMDLNSCDFSLQASTDGKARGSVYLHVLASSLLITIIGLGALAATRVQMHAARVARDSAQARVGAVSAIELGLLFVGQDPHWRQTWSSGVWLDDRPLGSGRFTLEGVDPTDNVLDNSPYDLLVLTGTGTAGIARHKAQITLVPIVQPLEAMNTCLHGSGFIHVRSGRRITVVGAPLSTNSQLTNWGTVDGDAQVDHTSPAGTITGSLTVGGPAKPLPDPSVLAWYTDRGTPIPFTGDIDKAVLAPGYNPWGPADPNGLYVLNTQGNSITIRNTRIHGTLIVRAPNRTVTLENALHLENYRSDFPVLIVEGNLVIHCAGAEMPLSEADHETNYNPLGAPYDGAWDDDMDDVYPNEIRGLIHVEGSLTMESSSRVVGAVLCDGPITIDGTNTIVHDPSLYACPPRGYTFVEGMAVTPNSWRQVVD